MVLLKPQACVPVKNYEIKYQNEPGLSKDRWACGPVSKKILKRKRKWKYQASPKVMARTDFSDAEITHANV